MEGMLKVSTAKRKRGDMPANTKPVLSVIVDGGKRDQFSLLCSEHGRPMAWAINAFIDHCLENRSIELTTHSLVENGAEGLAELQSMMIELREDLKLIEASTVRLSFIGHSSTPDSEEADYAEADLKLAEEDVLARQKRQFIAEIRERMTGRR